MFLVLRNIVFDLIFLTSINFPVIQSCGTDSHNCSNISSTQIEVFLIQNGIDRAEIDFEQPDTGANYMWTLRPFNGSNPYTIDLTSPNYSSAGDIFSLIPPTVDNQGLYSCRTTTNQQQQCPRDYCVRLMSSPMIAMFNATYFMETNSTVFSLEVTYDDSADVTTCLPVNIIILRNKTTNLATCFGAGFVTCIGSVNVSNTHEPAGSGFKYNLTVSDPPFTAANDTFTVSVNVRTIVTPSPGTSTRLIIATETFSTSAMLTVISPTMPPEMTPSTFSVMPSLSSSVEPVMSNTELMSSSTTLSSPIISISATTPGPNGTTATQLVAIIVPSAIGGFLIVILFTLAFVLIMYLYPRITHKRGIYKPTDGDDNTINTNGAMEPPFELSPHGFSKEGKI